MPRPDLVLEFPGVGLSALTSTWAVLPIAWQCCPTATICLCANSPASPRTCIACPTGCRRRGAAP